jgi:hypothetical protein
VGLCKNQLEATQKGLKSSQDYLATQTNQLATQATELARYKADADSLKMALTSTEYQLNQVTAEKARLQETANKAQNSSFVSQREWQSSIDWSINNTGQVDCPQLYTSEVASCVVSGGPACVMSQAVRQATEGNYSRDLELTLITQCHNPAAQKQILAAGEKAVGEYLRAR